MSSTWWFSKGEKMSTMRHIRGGRRGAVVVLAMIFIAVFSALAVALATVSGSNLQMASNQHKLNGALHAAQSGLECARYLVRTVTGLPLTNTNTVSTAQANQTWTRLCSYIQTTGLDGKTVLAASRFTDALGSGDELVTPALRTGVAGEQFTVRLYRYDADPRTIKAQIMGTDGLAVRHIGMDMAVMKDREVLDYAVASRTRTWLAGDVTIHGNMYSAWKYQHISPFHMTSDAKVLGRIGTILDKVGPDLYAGGVRMPYDLETLDSKGNPVYNASGNKVISLTDELQGQYKSIDYSVSYGDKAVNMPGMKVADYDTSSYKALTTAIPASSYNTTTITEYAPHALGNYSLPGPSGGLKLTRYVVENQTLTNAQVVANRNALFRNCTFNGILYIDGGRTGYYNNIRFDNCTFNGPIVTYPSTVTASEWWQRNQLYFTGAATFQNQTDVPATIMAPNFSVDIGNTNPTRSTNNVLTGAVIGGIVDVRGHAQIYGTIISMFDTSSYPSGYVSNLGATLGDGGSETTAPGDVGVITITPDPDQMLPNGIMSPIIIQPDPRTYSECV
jgi:Tfp pilus assembly protein PilX